MLIAQSNSDNDTTLDAQVWTVSISLLYCNIYNGILSNVVINTRKSWEVSSKDNTKAKTTLSCRNICHTYRAIRHKKGSHFDSSCNRYSLGQKRCQICDIYLVWNGIRSPCCRAVLRTRPRPKKYREKFLQQLESC